MRPALSRLSSLLLPILALLGCGAGAQEAGAHAEPVAQSEQAEEGQADVRPPDEPPPPPEPPPAVPGEPRPHPDAPALTAQAAEAPLSPSLSERLTMPGPLACLGEQLEAIVALGRVGEAQLLIPPVSNHPAQLAYELLPLDAPPRNFSVPGVGLLRPEPARALGLSGSALLASLRLPADDRGCQRVQVGLASARRLDASAALPIDFGATLEALLGRYRRGQPGRAVLDARAARAIALRHPPRPPRDRGDEDDASEADEERPLRRSSGRGVTAAGVMMAEPSGPTGSQLFFTLRWSPAARQLTIYVLARAYDQRSERRANDDPYAGSVNCHAPPGADCAPYCIPPALLVTTRYTGEAGVRVVYDERGRQLSIASEALGTLHPAEIHRQGIGDCN